MNERPTVPGRRIVWLMAIVIVLVVALVLILFVTGPRADRLYKV